MNVMDSEAAPGQRPSTISMTVISRLIVLTVLTAGLPALTGCDTKEGAAAPAQKATTVSAQTPKPAPDPLQRPTNSAISNPADYTTVGPLVVERQADVLAERDGTVTSVRTELGEHVRKGQVLALLDERSDQAAYAAKSARIDSLKAQIREWEAEQKGNEADLRRADAMYAERIMSQEDQEHVRYKLDETIAEVSRYKAEEAAAESDLKSISIQMEETRVLSPISGVVGRRSVREAQEVKKGDPLFWISAEFPLRIIFTVPESAMAKFVTGAQLELSSTVFPELHQAAVVVHVSPVVDPASGSIEVIGLLQHPSPLLKPGMSMQVRLDAR